MAKEEEELEMAIRMSMQSSPPEPKRSRPGDANAAAVEESPEARNRRTQRELMAAAAEKRIMAAKSAAQADRGSSGPRAAATSSKQKEKEREKLGREISMEEANELFSMIFGGSVSREVLAQWTNQGIRFSTDLETSMGLVQHEGGPCGVLAAIQGFVLKHLLFIPEGLQNLSSRTSLKTALVTPEKIASLSEDTRKRALVRSIGEILFRCGNNERAIIATLEVLEPDAVVASGVLDDLAIAKALEDLSFESASDLQRTLRVYAYTSTASAFKRLEAMIPVFRSRMGAMLFLISALLSRGLDSVQGDRDDPSQPLVTAPFGHASQEIVNLLLCGEAVPNVFDDKIDLGGGMFLKGVSANVEVGFLTLLESLNFCKVGHHLKRPKWPIWVVGSESHYTVLFAFDPSVQDENEMEEREARIRRAFDVQDQSGGGGFITAEGLKVVLAETNINFPSEKLDQLCSAGFIVWSEFWQVLLGLDKNMGGFKDSSGLMGKKVFDIYHFNGIAKSISNGNQMISEGETPVQRPRLTKLRVSVPPRWTQEEYLAETARKDGAQAAEHEARQHAPLVDCIRTRWPRAECNWMGDPPSIV